MNHIRLDKFVSERTEYSRSQIKTLIKKGGIKIDGSPAKSPDIKIDPDLQKVYVCGSEITYRDHTYVLLNKPAGYVCSFGALLITDDGELAHKMLSPKQHIPKLYIVKLDRPFENKYINLFENGITLADGHHCLPAKVLPAENNEKLAFIELFEGKYHQVKRMFAAVGNHVEVLMRISLGSLVLPEKLGIGECMELLHKDVENLFKPLDFNLFCRNFNRHFSAFPINKLP